jgi:predicted dehydrogenase
VTPPIRVGVVGYGLGGSTFHAPLVAATEGLELAAIATSNAERVAKAKARYPDAHLYDTLDAMLAAEPLELVVISTPHATHAPYARTVLSKGAHVVVDKPFALTSAEARELAAEAKKSGKLAIPFQNRRWDNEVLTLRKLMDEGTLGDIHRYESRYERWRGGRSPARATAVKACSATSRYTWSIRRSCCSAPRAACTPSSSDGIPKST